MGGQHSGRLRTRSRGALNVVPRLDIRTMRRQGVLRAGHVTTGALSWTAGEANIRYVGVSVDLREPEAGLLTVAFAPNGEARRQEIKIESRTLPYGGRRYYFVCPQRARRCEVLGLVDGQFASRQAHRLTYRSQSDDRLERVRSRRDRLWARLRPEGRQGPRGRNRERLLNAWCEAERTLDQMLAPLLDQMRRADEGAAKAFQSDSTELPPAVRAVGSAPTSRPHILRTRGAEPNNSMRLRFDSWKLLDFGQQGRQSTARGPA